MIMRKWKEGMENDVGHCSFHPTKATTHRSIRFPIMVPSTHTQARVRQNRAASGTLVEGRVDDDERGNARY